MIPPAESSSWLQQRLDKACLGQVIEHQFGVALGDCVQHVGAELRGGLVERGGQLGQRDIGRDVFELVGGEEWQQLGEGVRVDPVQQAATFVAVEGGERVGLVGGMQIVQEGSRRGEFAGVDAGDDVPDRGAWLGSQIGAAG